jgi:hypothetical protein
MWVQLNQLLLGALALMALLTGALYSGFAR